MPLSDETPRAPTQRRRLVIRKARRAEAEAISGLILRAIEVTNARDYAPQAIAALKASFATAEIERRMRERHMHVATIGGALVGTASLAKADPRLHSVFVDPERQGEGIGLALVRFIEQLAQSLGHARLELTSSLTAVPFYRKLGYRGRRREARGGIVETVWMSKRLG